MSRGKSRKNPISNERTPMSPDIWGPHYWFVIHSMAYYYPEYPTNVTKRKYYEFIQNLPLFLPDEKIGNEFSAMLEKYPVSPFLDNRESFLRWTHFIHNKINVKLGKEEISIYKALDEFYYNFLPKPVIEQKKHQIWNDIAYVTCLMGLILLMYMFSSSNSSS
jgi:hypothetical protein